MNIKPIYYGSNDQKFTNYVTKFFNIYIQLGNIKCLMGVLWYPIFLYGLPLPPYILFLKKKNLVFCVII